MKPKWHAGLILVCEKCGKKLSENQADVNPSFALKDWLKKKLLSQNLWGVTRVVNSTCLDICPEGKVAVAGMSDHPDSECWAECIDPVNDREKILEIVLERVKASSP